MYRTDTINKAIEIVWQAIEAGYSLDNAIHKATFSLANNYEEATAIQEVLESLDW